MIQAGLWPLPLRFLNTGSWEDDQHKDSGTKTRIWRRLAHLVCVYLTPVANRAPVLSQCSSRAGSPATDSPLSQTAAATTTAINYSPELCLLVYLWGWRPRPECRDEWWEPAVRVYRPVLNSNHIAERKVGNHWTHVMWQPKPEQEMLLCWKSTGPHRVEPSALS